MTARAWSGCCATARVRRLLVERLRNAGSALVYRCAKQRSEPGGDKRADQRGVNHQGARADELTLTPLELIDRIAALVPPPRTHRHRYFGVLAPNSPLRAAAVAMALPAAAQSATGQAGPATIGEGMPHAVPLGHTGSAQPAPVPQPVPPKRCPAHYLWAVLIARIYEVFPLPCPLRGRPARVTGSKPIGSCGLITFSKA